MAGRLAIPGAIVRALVGMVLLVAAAFKSDQLLGPDIAGRERWLQLSQVEFEIFLGIWILSGVWRRWAVGLALACFVVFAGVSFYEALRGSPSCGCFGEVEVNPWFTFGLDLFILGMLALFWPEKNEEIAGRRTAILAVMAAALAVGIGGWEARTIVTYQVGRVLPDGTIVGDTTHVVLDPKQWLGQDFPLAPHLSAAPDLRHGRWNLMFFHHNCPLCLASFDQLLPQLKTFHDRAVLDRILLVQVPPFGPFPQEQRLSEYFRIAKLDPARDWRLGTPYVVKLDDGKVTFAGHGYIALPSTRPSTTTQSDSGALNKR